MKKYLPILLSAGSAVLGLLSLLFSVSSLKQTSDLALGERTSLFRPYITVSGTSTAQTANTTGTSTPANAGSYRGFIDTANAAFKGLIIRGVTGQTANLLELQNGSGAVLWSIGGDGSSSSTNATSSRFYADFGTVAAPSYTFNGDEDSGLFRVGSNNIALGVAGSNIADFNGARLQTAVVFNAPNGSVGAPSYSFTNDADTGIFLGNSSGNNLSFAAGGAQRFTIDTLFVSSTLSIVPATNNSIDIGTANLAWRNFFASGTNSQFGSSTFSGHVEVANNTQYGKPSVSSCGTGTPVIIGTDNAGKVTVGSGGAPASCLLTFSQPFSLPPACTVNNESQVLLTRAVSTTSTVTFSVAVAFGASDILSYNCIAGQR